MFKCKHNAYKIITCNYAEKYYICQCEKCGLRFVKDKAIGEMYSEGTIIKLKNKGGLY